MVELAERGCCRLAWSLVCIVLLYFLILAPIDWANAAGISIGMNYAWWRLDPANLIKCKTHPGAAFWHAGILPQYGQEGVRATVQQQLKSMKASGFTTIRTLIMNRRPPPRDGLDGTLVSMDGSIAPQDRQNIAKFVSDVRGAGFHFLEISFGFLTENGPYCRRKVYGDCFDITRAAENWRFIEEATRAVMSSTGGMEVRFDLQNEGCPSHYLAATTIKRVSAYLQTISLKFQQTFGNNWLVSCPDAPHAERISLLLDALGKVGLTPKYLEEHTYKMDAAAVGDMLDAASAAAQRIGADLIIGESRYHSPQQAAIFGDWLRAHPGNPIININEWPLSDRRPPIGCGFDTPPPYTPGSLLTIK
jgi:hypothetical protein